MLKELTIGVGLKIKNHVNITLTPDSFDERKNKSIADFLRVLKFLLPVKIIIKY